MLMILSIYFVRIHVTQVTMNQLKQPIAFNSVYIKGLLTTYNYNNILAIWEHEVFFVI